jgi:FtsP/CotA-like multicopper oxidase with cupredoxin domain
MHWHGFEDTIQNDGMPGTSQPPLKPGGLFVYEFDIHQAGTYFYHSHMAMQEMAGMPGAFIMHPKESYRPHCDKDFLIHLQEYAVLPNNTVPNTMNMEFNSAVVQWTGRTGHDSSYRSAWRSRSHSFCEPGHACEYVQRFYDAERELTVSVGVFECLIYRCRLKYFNLQGECFNAG